MSPSLLLRYLFFFFSFFFVVFIIIIFVCLVTMLGVRFLGGGEPVTLLDLQQLELERLAIGTARHTFPDA